MVRICNVWKTILTARLMRTGEESQAISMVQQEIQLNTYKHKTAKVTRAGREERKRKPVILSSGSQSNVA